MSTISGTEPLHDIADAMMTERTHLICIRYLKKKDTKIKLKMKRIKITNRDFWPSFKILSIFILKPLSNSRRASENGATYGRME